MELSASLAPLKHVYMSYIPILVRWKKWQNAEKVSFQVLAGLKYAGQGNAAAHINV